VDNDRELLALIGQIYESAIDTDRLANLCTVMAPHFGCESSLIHTCTESSLEVPGILSGTENLDESALTAYSAHYHDCNLWFQRGIRKGPSVVVICQELVPDSELLRSEWYDFCRTVDWFHCLGIGVSIGQNLVGGIGFHRPRSAKPYEDCDRRKAQFILPHLERALQIQHQLSALARERDATLDVVNGLDVAMIIVAKSGYLLFANNAAECVLRSGRILSLKNGNVCASDPRQQQKLQRLIGEAVHTSAGNGVGSGGILPLSGMGDTKLTLLIAPLRSELRGYGPGMPAAVVLFCDQDKPAFSEEVLREILQLTAAQGRLLAALLRGQNLREYAASAGISVNTAKTLMQQIFEKTGCSRQTDLIRTIASNPVFRLASRR